MLGGVVAEPVAGSVSTNCLRNVLPIAQVLAVQRASVPSDELETTVYMCTI